VKTAKTMQPHVAQASKPAVSPVLGSRTAEGGQVSKPACRVFSNWIRSRVCPIFSWGSFRRFPITHEIFKPRALKSVFRSIFVCLVCFVVQKHRSGFCPIKVNQGESSLIKANQGKSRRKKFSGKADNGWRRNQSFHSLVLLRLPFVFPHPPNPIPKTLPGADAIFSKLHGEFSGPVFSRLIPGLAR